MPPHRKRAGRIPPRRRESASERAESTPAPGAPASGRIPRQRRPRVTGRVGGRPPTAFTSAEDPDADGKRAAGNRDKEISVQDLLRRSRDQDES